jgi:hypothetical protein
MPYLEVNQAQKEITHNEALNVLDVFVQAVVKSQAAAPPVTPEPGDAHIIIAPATGAWTGKEGQVAYYQGGTWYFFMPFAGLRVWDKASQVALVYKGTTWQQELTAQGKIGFFGVTPVTKTTVTLGNVDNEIGSLSIGAAYSQTEVRALRDKSEALADDVRALKAALTSYGLV